VKTGTSGRSRTERDRDDRRLLERYHRDGDTAAREALAERWLEPAAALAQRYGRRSPADGEDLLAAANLGLANAIERFDLERGGTFAAFAIPTMLGEVRRHLRDNSWGMRVARPITERSVRINKLMPQLTQRLGRSPTTAEVAEALGCEVDDVLDVYDAERARGPASLQGQTASEDGEGRTLDEVVGEDDPEFSHVEAATSTRHALRVLTERDARIVRLRFEDELTQSEIAERVGISQMQISRVLRQSLARLRELPELDAVADPDT
jgi:RNA polymerase sigma-B factor